MDSVVVTLRHQQNEVDVELPVNTPFSVLGPILTDVIPIDDPASPEPNRTFSGRVITSGVVVRPKESLFQAGVVDGDVLELLITSLPQVDPSMASPPKKKGTYLQCVETGTIFSCRGNATLIGRTHAAAIDLSVLPKSNMVSRKHANLLRRGDGFWIKDEHSTNRTIVDGYTLEGGKRIRLRAGSLIQFGSDGPTLVFHST